MPGFGKEGNHRAGVRAGVGVGAHVAVAVAGGKLRYDAIPHDVCCEETGGSAEPRKLAQPVVLQEHVRVLPPKHAGQRGSGAAGQHQRARLPAAQIQRSLPHCFLPHGGGVVYHDAYVCMCAAQSCSRCQTVRQKKDAAVVATHHAFAVRIWSTMAGTRRALFLASPLFVPQEAVVPVEPIPNGAAAAGHEIF